MSSSDNGTTEGTPIRLGHSPDSDDAFMFYGLAEGHVDTEGLRFEHILRDIETLNQWALEGRLEITAISVHAYAYVADKYAILTHGASMGDNYGPMVVTREEVGPEWLAGRRIAIPGTMTSAYLALRLYLGDFEYDIMPFDEIMEAVSSGKAEAGLLIHEGQLTHGSLGLHSVVDLGKWWHARTGGLPLPLGVNAVRRDLGPAAGGKIDDCKGCRWKIVGERSGFRIGRGGECNCELVQPGIVPDDDRGFRIRRHFLLHDTKKLAGIGAVKVGDLQQRRLGVELSADKERAFTRACCGRYQHDVRHEAVARHIAAHFGGLDTAALVEPPVAVLPARCVPFGLGVAQEHQTAHQA